MNDHVTESRFSSSTGTRHSKCSPRKNPLGQRHTRPTVHSGSLSLVFSRTRLYTKPYSNSSKASLRCAGARAPVPPFRRAFQFSCIHSKCTGSIEFSSACSQLHGTSAKTICTNPFFQEKGSQSGRSGAG